MALWSGLRQVCPRVPLSTSSPPLSFPLPTSPLPGSPRCETCAVATGLQQIHRDPEMEEQGLERGNLTPVSPRPSREEPEGSRASVKDAVPQLAR